MPRKRIVLLNAVTTTTDGSQELIDETNRTYQALIAGTGAVTGTVLIEVSNDSQATSANVQWTLMGTIELSGTTTDTGGFPSVVPWLLTRARVTAISGTGAAITVLMGA